MDCCINYVCGTDLLNEPGMLEEDTKDAIEGEVKTVNASVEPQVLGKERVDPFPNFLTTNIPEFPEISDACRFVEDEKPSIEKPPFLESRNYHLI